MLPYTKQLYRYLSSQLMNVNQYIFLNAYRVIGNCNSRKVNNLILNIIIWNLIVTCTLFSYSISKNASLQLYTEDQNQNFFGERSKFINENFSSIKYSYFFIQYLNAVTHLFLDLLYLIDWNWTVDNILISLHITWTVFC